MQLPWDGGWWPRPERRWRGGLLEGRVLRCLNQNLQDLGIFRIAGDRSGAGTAGARGRGSGDRGRGSGVRGQGIRDRGRKTVRWWRGGYWGGRCGVSPRTREGRRPDRPNGHSRLAARAHCGYEPGPKIFRFADRQESCYTTARSKYHLRRRKTVQRQERTMQKYKVSIEYCVS